LKKPPALADFVEDPLLWEIFDFELIRFSLFVSHNAVDELE